MDKKRVVILGGSFAGLNAAKQLTSHRLDVTVVDPSSHFTWTPNIHEMLSGIKRRDDVLLSRQQLLDGLGHRFVQARVTQLNPEQQVVTLGNQELLPYDACLIACGQTSAHQPGTTPNQFAFRSATDIEQIHHAIKDKLAIPRPVVITLVGGGFSGVEALGELLRRYRHNRRIKIRVIESASRLLVSLPPVIAEDIAQLCRRYPVEFVFGQRVDEATDDQLRLIDGTVLQTDVTVWTVGNRLPDFLQQSTLADDDITGLPVNDSLQSVHAPGVFVAGDAAALAQPLRKQSSYALDMGALAGKNLRSWLQGDRLQDYRPSHKPLLLSFGDLNTYLIMDQTVVASPLLAAMKEAVYQLYMAKLSTPLPWFELGMGITGRYCNSLGSLLLPELEKPRPLRILRASQVLQWGNSSDLLQLVRATQASLLPG